MNDLDFRKCKLCGKTFRSLGSVICPDCGNQLDEDFVKIRDFIYDSETDVNIADVMAATNVPEKNILYLLKEERLIFGKVIIHADLYCEACGAHINAGKLCAKCAAAWGQAVNENEKKTAEEEKAIQAKREADKHRIYIRKWD